MRIGWSAIIALFSILASAQSPMLRSFPPPGSLVDAGGYRVHLNCTGAGQPTVMIMGAGYSFDWSLVQPEAAGFTRVCSYDPAGTAWSDPGPVPTCDGRIQELHSVLHNASITGPLVLVGHSVGAAFARLYAARYPAEVQGMVIVDHAGRYRIPGGERMLRSEELTLQRLPPAARDMHHWAAALPGASNRAANTRFFDTCIAATAATTATRSDPLGDRPLIVIANGALAASPDYLKVQDGLLGLSHNSKAMIAPNSGHAVPMEDPAVIVQAIRQVVLAARSHTNLK